MPLKPIKEISKDYKYVVGVFEYIINNNEVLPGTLIIEVADNEEDVWWDVTCGNIGDKDFSFSSLEEAKELYPKLTAMILNCARDEIKCLEIKAINLFALIGGDE